MNIIVDLNYPIKDGTEVVFRSPVDCSQVAGLLVNYQDNGNCSKEFAFADAHGNNVGDIDHLFAENVAVKVILDVTTGMAFVQNADTNAYLEGRFKELEAKTGIVPMKGEELDSIADSKELVVGTLYITTTDCYMAYVNAPAGTLYLVTGVGAIEEQVRLKGTSIYTVTGEELEYLVGTGRCEPGCSYLVTETFYSEYLDAKTGDVFKAIDTSQLSYQMNIIGDKYVLTEADKNEIVQAVIDALPIYGGETEEVVANE